MFRHNNVTNNKELQLLCNSNMKWKQLEQMTNCLFTSLANTSYWHQISPKPDDIEHEMPRNWSQTQTHSCESTWQQTANTCRKQELPCSSACTAFCLRFSSIRSLFCCLLSSLSSLSFACVTTVEDAETKQWQNYRLTTTESWWFNYKDRDS